MTDRIVDIFVTLAIVKFMICGFVGTLLVLILFEFAKILLDRRKDK